MPQGDQLLISFSSLVQMVFLGAKAKKQKVDVSKSNSKKRR